MAAPVKVEHHGNIRWRVLRVIDGKQKARFFETEKEANQFALAEGSDSIPQFMALPDGTRGRLLACLTKAGSIDELEKLVGTGLALRPATDKPLWHAVDECALCKEKAKKSALYVSNFYTALRHLDRKFPNRTVASFNNKEIQQWLDESGWADESKRTFLARVRTFFGWAKKRGYCATDPTEGVEAPEWVATRPVIFTVEEVYRLMSACLEVDPGMSHYFAIAVFAGVRPAECRRLKQENVVEDFLEVEAKSSKVRVRRLVAIEGNLKEWLDLPGGEMAPSNWRRRFRKVVDASGLTWTPDVLRHSFCSYSVSVKGAKWTSDHAGNSEDVLFRHYRELVRPKEAARFFEITPARVLEWRKGQQATSPSPAASSSGSTPQKSSALQGSQTREDLALAS